MTALKVSCRTPAKGRDGVTNIPKWKFDCIRAAILDAATTPVTFKALPAEVDKRLTAEERADLGSLGWHVTCVKLELEVRGEIERLSVRGPQQIRTTTP